MTAKMVTLHVFRQLSPDQPRGLSWFMTVLLALSDLNQTLYQRPFGLTLLGFPSLAKSDSMQPEEQKAGRAGIVITRRELAATKLRTAAGRTQDARGAWARFSARIPYCWNIRPQVE